jgi:hypothetical protein
MVFGGLSDASRRETPLRKAEVVYESPVRCDFFFYLLSVHRLSWFIIVDVVFGVEAS